MIDNQSATQQIEAGLAAQRRGDPAGARRHYLEAARLLLAQARAAKSTALRRQSYAQAQQLLARAEEMGAQQANQARRPGQAGRGREPLREGEETPTWLLPERPRQRLQDVAGLDDVKEQIHLKLILPFTHPEEAERYGVRPGGGILLYGPPGVGKTFIAGAVAGELDAAFFVARASSLMSQWFGKAEQNVAALFEAARKEERAVIFLDEIEALVPKRGATRSSVMPRVISEFLSQTQGLGQSGGAVLLLGATNEPWAIDDAALRPGRFDELIYVGLPDFQARLRLLELGLNQRPLAPGVDLAELATRMEGYSGADIAYICTRVSERAFLDAIEMAQGRDIDMDDFAAILAERRPSVTHRQIQRYEAFRDGRR